MNRDEAIEFLKKQNYRQVRYIKTKYPEYYDFLITNYPNVSSLPEALFLDMNTSKIPSCKYGNSLKFRQLKVGYKFCGPKNACQCNRDNQSEIISYKQQIKSDEEKFLEYEKRKKTTQKLLGVDNPAQHPEVQKKMRKTNKERHGKEYYSQTEEYNNKIFLTQRKKFNVDHFTQHPDVKAKLTKTNLELYGHKCSLQNEEVAKKATNTLLELYGVDNVFKLKSMQEYALSRMLELYGDTKALRVKQIVENMISKNIKKYDTKYPNQHHYSDIGKQIINDPILYQNTLHSLSVPEFAMLMNCNINTIYKHCKKFGIELPPVLRSSNEVEISKILDDYGIRYISNYNNNILKGKQTLDFYLPDFNIAIEFNGLYWHSENFGKKNKHYHANKHNLCKDNDIKLFSIHSDDWESKKQQWINKILYSTQKLDLEKIYARKCNITEVSQKIANEFYDKHHFQGKTTSQMYNFALYHNDVIVMIMSFNKPRNNDPHTIELNRLCSHSTCMVVGGASKLLKYFIKNIPDNIRKIISFSNNEYSNGGIYETLGFHNEYDIPPDYSYIISNNRVHKQNYRKDKIKKRFEIDNDIINDYSEWELMQQLGYDRIWDCGKIKWQLEIKKEGE